MTNVLGEEVGISLSPDPYGFFGSHFVWHLVLLKPRGYM